MNATTPGSGLLFEVDESRGHGDSERMVRVSLVYNTLDMNGHPGSTEMGGTGKNWPKVPFQVVPANFTNSQNGNEISLSDLSRRLYSNTSWIWHQECVESEMSRF